MYESPFENASGTTAYFLTPQLEHAFEAILEEVHFGRLLSCAIGFPKSGKTAFLTRLSSLLREHTIILSASAEENLSRTLSRQLSPQEEAPSSLSRELQEKLRVVLIIDDAHLLQDDDFAFMAGLFTLAKHKGSVLQVVLIGNGELIHKLARPDNRNVQALLGNIINLPKLTREQAFEYMRFLLNSAGLDGGLISDPEPLVRRASGIVGILRILTITLALKALSGQHAADVEAAFEPGPTNKEAAKESRKETAETAVLTQEELQPAGQNHMLLLGTLLFITLIAALSLWFLSGPTPIGS